MTSRRRLRRRSGSPSPAALQASATPRPFGVQRQVVDVASPRRARGRGVVGDERVDRAVGRCVGDGRAGAARRLEPEVDDRRALDDGLVAEHGDRLARRGSPRAARGTRRSVRHAPRAGRRRARRAPGAAASRARRPPRPTRRRRARSRSTAPPARSSSSARSSASSHESASKRRGPALRSGVVMRSRACEVREGEAALVAEPALVDLGVVAREDALDLALARRRADVAADRAEAADRRHVLDLPRPRLEAVLRRGERADRAELGHVAGEVALVRLVLERRDHRLRAAVDRDELAVLGDRLAEARAAVAEDAALAVERDQRRDRDRLLERALRERHARVARPVAERQVLQRALAALVADGAVERVVDEDELERRVLALGGLRRRARGLHDHAVLRASACSRPAASASPRPRRGTCGRRRPAARAAARSRRRESRSRPPQPSRRSRCPSAPARSARRS